MELKSACRLEAMEFWNEHYKKISDISASHAASHGGKYIMLLPKEVHNSTDFDIIPGDSPIELIEQARANGYELCPFIERFPD